MSLRRKLYEVIEVAGEGDRFMPVGIATVALPTGIIPAGCMHELRCEK